MSAELRLVDPAPPYDWNRRVWEYRDHETRLDFAERRYAEAATENTRLRRALRDTREPGAALAAWVFGALVFAAGAAAGVCFEPLLTTLLLVTL